MIKQLLFIFLFIGFTSATAQTRDSNRRKTKPSLVVGDKAIEKIRQVRDSAIKQQLIDSGSKFPKKIVSYSDSIQRAEEMDRNLNSILTLQKEQKARQKKAAIIRILIGVGFLALMIVGLSRRRRMNREKNKSH